MHDTPKAPDLATEAAWAESRRRRRLLEGDWRDDLRSEIRHLVGENRSAIWGSADTAKNLARSIIFQLSTLYNQPASVINENATASAELTTALDDAGHWQIMQGFSPLIIGQREGLVRVDLVDDPVTGMEKILTRVVPADLVAVRAHPDCPDVPTRIEEYRVRKNERMEPEWYRDVFDISNPDDPWFAILDADDRVMFDSMKRGDEYRWRYADRDNRPFIPGEWFHASRTGKLRDPKFGCELFDGALTVAAYWTLWGHVVRDCSWPQRYAVGARIPGVVSEEGDGMPHVETDPSSLVHFEADPGATVSIGQFAPGGDPAILGQSIRDYAADLATDFDISPADIQRATGDARSGYAISLTREGQRHAQRRYEQSFRRHDRAIVGKVAAMLGLPSMGWDVQYHGLPLSLEERKAELDEQRARLEMGLSSPVALLARLDSIPEEEARKRLVQYSDDNRRFSVTPR